MGTFPIHAATRQRGATYLEIMVALLIFSVCLAPALDAMTSGLVTIPAVAASSRDIGCVRTQMEKVLAEPYANLLQAAVAAGAKTVPAATYSLAADAECPARNTFLARYDPDSAGNLFVSADSGMLFVRVAAADGAASLASLAVRP
jgi:type II secretory pathway pseudopilin PulG